MKYDLSNSIGENVSYHYLNCLNFNVKCEAKHLDQHIMYNYTHANATKARFMFCFNATM